MRSSVLVLLSLLTGCDGRPPGVEQQAIAHQAVLGHLQSRSQRLTIYSTPAGPRFSITTLTGQLLSHGLSLDDLRSRNPEMWRIYKDSLAGRPLDATLNPPRQDRTANPR